MYPMGGPVKRPYRSPLREQAARRTRSQIRDAAARLFVQQGYALTTMRQIADTAEVSERTAYLAFPSKLDLFMDVIGVATAGDDQPIPIAERSEFQSSLSERDGKKALGLLVSMVTKPLAPGTAECQALFPTYRVLVIAKSQLRRPYPTSAHPGSAGRSPIRCCPPK